MWGKPFSGSYSKKPMHHTDLYYRIGFFRWWKNTSASAMRLFSSNNLNQSQWILYSKAGPSY